MALYCTISSLFDHNCLGLALIHTSNDQSLSTIHPQNFVFAPKIHTICLLLYSARRDTTIARQFPLLRPKYSFSLNVCDSKKELFGRWKKKIRHDHNHDRDYDRDRDHDRL